MTNPSYKYRRAKTISSGRCSVSIVLTPTEFASLDAIARKHDMARAELVRRLVQGYLQMKENPT